MINPLFTVKFENNVIDARLVYSKTTIANWSTDLPFK
jgi:hypothetical protein